MKKALSLLLALLLVLALVPSFAEGAETPALKIGQVQFAAHGTKCFAVITAVVQGDTIVLVKIDEYQPMADATPVPNGENFAATEGQALVSKRVNNELYSANMQNHAGSTVQIAANYNAIEAYCTGKTIAELEGADLSAADAISGATLADKAGYVAGVVAAAKAAGNQTGTYTIVNKTGEVVTGLYLINNATGEPSRNYAPEAGMAPDAAFTVAYEVSADQIKEGEKFSMTLAFKTESGYEANFPTLHIETATINLKAKDAVDATSSPTAIEFPKTW